MDPFTIYAIISLVIAAGTTYQTQQQQNKLYKYQAKVAENNAKADEYEGQYAKDVSALKAKQHRLQVAQLIGKQRARMGATGVTVDEGSFMDLTLDTVEQGKIDELAILHEGDVAAWRANVGAENSKSEAGLFQASKRSETTSGLLAGAQSGVSSYGQFKLAQS